MKKTILLSTIILIINISKIYGGGGTIRGEVHYSGAKEGSVIVAAFNLQFDFNNIVLLDTLITGPGFYEFDSLGTGTYLVAAFMDVNGDGLPGFTEPLGAHPKTVEISDNIEVDNVDIYIKDLPRGASSISGTVTYNGSLPGTIHVYALGFTGTPFNHDSLPSSGGYNLSGLMSGEYLVVAYLDADGNEKPDIGEPVGYIEDKIKVGDSEDLTDYNLTLFDPTIFSSSIYGSISYTGSDSGTIYIYTVGLTHTPIMISEMNFPESSYEVSNLDQGEYYMFAFLDTNGNKTFDPLKLKLEPLPAVIPGELYELIAEPINLSVGEHKEQNLILNDKGDAGISGRITYNGNQSGLVFTAAVGLSPSWLGLSFATLESTNHYLYTIPYIDAGLYAVIGFMLTDLMNPTFNLNTPIGFYTKDLVHVTAHDTVTGIDFFLEDSTTSMSSISGTLTTPEGLEGDIYLFSLGISLTPYQHKILTNERTYSIPGLRMGRYLVAAFMDVNGDSTFELDEPFAFTESLVEIPHGNTAVTVNLDLKVEELTKIETATPDFQPDEFVLGNNYPNPFNPTTNFQYQLADYRKVTIKVFSLLGSEVRTLINKKQPAGLYQISWDGKDNNGKDVASGVYLYCLKAGAFVDFKKMTLIR